MGEKNGPRGLTPRQAGAVCFVALLPPATRLLPGSARRPRGARAGSALLLRCRRCCWWPGLCGGCAPGPGRGRTSAASSSGAWAAARARRAFCLRAVAGVLRGLLPAQLGLALYLHHLSRRAALALCGRGLAAGLAAVLSPGRALARASELFRWLLLLALAPILLLGLADVDFGSLLPSIPRTPCPCWRARCPRWGPGPSSS